MKNSYLDKLNEVQKEIVSSIKGPMMVIAGAGSGKTSVLTARTAHLLESGVSPSHILALTFTNKAAKEMKERISKIIKEGEALWMGTFHSIFCRILRIEGSLLGYPSNFIIYDSQDCQSLIKKIIEELFLDKDLYKPKTVLGRISQYKNNLITVKAYFGDLEIQQKDAASMRPKMGEIYKEYVNRCFQAGVMDFDDLLLKTNELLNLFPAVLYKYQERFKYILVDEYQDTNHCQYLIVKTLASRYENLCIVGDDAQSIYSFRGANIANILNFQKDYPDAKVFRLEQNYRSTEMIVEAANSLISKNKNQLRKKVWTSNKKGEKVKLYRAISEVQEAAYLVNKILNLKEEKGYHNKDFGILYRTNAQSRALEEALLKKNVSYQIYGGLSFFQRKEIKDFLAYLRVLVNKKDEEALLRMINYPARGIGDTTLEKISVVAKEEKKSFYEILENLHFYNSKLLLNKGTLNKLESFVFMIKEFESILDEGLYNLALEIAKKSGFINLMKADESSEGKSRYQNLEELLGSIEAYEQEQSQLVEGDSSISGFLESISLFSHLDESQEKDNKVSLMSIHLSKGLEFPIVFVTGLEEGLFPSMMSFYLEEEMEEERRLFYVALTRAKEQLFLSYAIMRSRWGKLIEGEPSRFIFEINEEFLDNSFVEENQAFFSQKSHFANRIKERKFKENSIPSSKFKSLKTIQGKPLSQDLDYKIPKLEVGMDVFHERFGKGKVIKLQGTNQDKMAIISFEEVGEKKLLLKFAKLRIINP